MPRELAACVERANLDPDVHVIALAGNGSGFCGGYDLVASAEHDMEGAGAAGRARGIAARPAWSGAEPRSVGHLGSDHRLPDDEPQPARLHEPLPLGQAGGLQGARVLRRGRDRHGALLGPARDRGHAPRSATRRRGYGASRRPRCGRYRIGPARAKRLLFTGDSPLRHDGGRSGASPPRSRPRASSTSGSSRCSSASRRVPINQLVMHKLLVNQTLYAQGLQATQIARASLRRDRAPHAGGLRVAAARGREGLQGGRPRARRALRRRRP